jgi:Zn-finger nucleic acid-binding protein
MQLTCPKCQGAMRQYERNGVHVDQCTECRGIFLDRGELEKLIDAETSWNSSQAAQPAAAAPAPVPAPAPGRSQPGYQQQPYQEHGYQEHGHQQHGYQPGYGQHGHHKKKRRSFLEDLFD